ncbi:hypothetical protein [Streptomyces sp. NPDC057552]|uniref:hypothetical protein n=1 Tax=Streptomyces sp. NPDC057552 TaxID=3350537 RepID=UPI00367D8777
MAASRHTPPRRTEAAARRPRPAPLSPHPEWRAQHLFIEPRYCGLITPPDDEDDEVAVLRPHYRPRRP